MVWATLTLNKWLIENRGYDKGNNLIWSSFGKLGATFYGFISNIQIKEKLDEGKILILNVRAAALSFHVNPTR
jgi:hypothetical protein